MYRDISAHRYADDHRASGPNLDTATRANIDRATHKYSDSHFHRHTDGDRYTHAHLHAHQYGDAAVHRTATSNGDTAQYHHTPAHSNPGGICGCSFRRQRASGGVV